MAARKAKSLTVTAPANAGSHHGSATDTVTALNSSTELTFVATSSTVATAVKLSATDRASSRIRLTAIRTEHHTPSGFPGGVFSQEDDHRAKRPQQTPHFEGDGVWSAPASIPLQVPVILTGHDVSREAGAQKCV